MTRFYVRVNFHYLKRTDLTFRFIKHILYVNRYEIAKIANIIGRFIMRTYDFEPMSIGGILDRTFKIYKDNFIRFITIVAIIQVPIALIMIISLSVLQRGAPVQNQNGSNQSISETRQNPGNFSIERSRTRTNNTGQDEHNPFVFLVGSIGMIVSSILGMLGHILCRGALTKSVSESYLGTEITVAQAYSFVLPKFLTLIGAGILVVLIIYMGLILLIVPGIIFALWFALTTPAIVVENLKAIKGLSRSKALASGNLGKIFSVGFLVVVISWVIGIPFSLAGSYLGRILFSNNIMLMTFVNQLISIIGQILIVPIGAIAYILLYYDLRIRKEGFDLIMLANSISSEQGGINVGKPEH